MITDQFACDLLFGQLDFAHAALANGLDKGVIARRGGNHGTVFVLGGVVPPGVG